MGVLNSSRKAMKGFIEKSYSMGQLHGEMKKINDPRRQNLIETVHLTKAEENKIDTLFVSTYGKTIDLTIERDGKLLHLQATPKLVGEDKMPQLGVVADMNVELTYERYNPIEAVGKAVQMVWQINTDTLIYLKQIITGQRSASELRGPVGIAEASGDAAKGGWFMFVLFLAQVSIGIGFVNLLPVPILDGGHLAFMAYEAVARKPASEKVQEALLKVGMVLLLALFVFTLFKDIPRVIGRVFGL